MNTGIRWLSSFSLLLTLVAPVVAQGKLELQASIEPAVARPGDTVTLVLTATVADGWHAYGTREKGNVPVALKPEKQKLGGLELAGAAVIPPGERHEVLGIAQFPLPNEFTVKQSLKVPAGIAAGEVKIAGELTYQICDENMCLPPATKAFTAKVTVQGAAGAAGAAAATQEPKPAPGTKPGLKLDPDGEKVTIVARVEPGAARPGDTVKLVLDVAVDARFHAYGSKETGNFPVGLDAAKCKFGGLEPVGPAQIPPGERQVTLGIESFPLPQEFQVVQTLRVPAGSKAGDVAIAGALDYQVCDENSCLPPATAAFVAKLVVQDPAGGPPGAKPGRKPGADEKFTIVARFDPNPARAGETVTLVLQCTVDPRYHAYGTKETTNVPVALDGSKVKTGGLELVGEADVPPGERTEKPGLGVTWPLPHEFEVAQLLTVPADAKPGPVVVEGVLDYQVCDENSCDLAAEGAFHATLEIEAGAPRAAAPPVQAPKDGNGQGPVLRQPKYTLADVGAADGLKGSWWSLILLSIAGGLFALVMPCTYPMIPITFSFFTKQADRLHGKVMSLALAYGFGIVLMFVLVGIVVGDPIVRFAGHWATNLVIGAAFVVFALSLFGFFTLQLPSFVTNAAGKASATGGLLGVFLMGATLVISSFTCTAPIVGALLAGVGEGGYVRVGVGMAVFGLTMAAPFVFLALLPGRVKALPKSGEWMNTLKISLGFVELAAALKFFSNVELTLGWGVLPRETFLMVWAFLFTALALFLFGMLGYREVPVAGVSKARNGFGLLSLGFAFYCLFGVTGFTLDPIMTAFEPPYRLRPVDEHTIVKDDHAAAVALAAREHKYVLVNFTGFT